MNARIAVIVCSNALLLGLSLEASAARVTTQFRARVQPDRVMLSCRDSEGWDDEQSYEIGGGGHLVGHVRRVEAMIAAGYSSRTRRAGGRDYADLKRRLGVRAEHSRVLQLRAGANGERMRLEWRMSSPAASVRHEPPAAWGHASDRTRRNADRWVAEFGRRVERQDEGVDRALNLLNHYYAMNEREMIRTMNAGQFQRRFSIKHCGRQTDFTLTVQWRRVVDGPLGSEGRTP